MDKETFRKKMQAIICKVETQISFAETAYLAGYCTKEEKEKSIKMIKEDGAQDLFELQGYFENQEVLGREVI